MNVTRGYIRLSIAVVGTWVAVWGSIAAFANWQWKEWSEALSNEIKAGGPTQTIQRYSETANEYLDTAVFATKCGLLAMPLVLLFALGWWVFLGFSTKD
jgi:hypothetical protein